MEAEDHEGRVLGVEGSSVLEMALVCCHTISPMTVERLYVADWSSSAMPTLAPPRRQLVLVEDRHVEARRAKSRVDGARIVAGAILWERIAPAANS